MASILSLLSLPEIPVSVLAGGFLPIILWLVVSTIQTYWRLSHVPGPFLAKFTNLSRLLWVKSNRAHDVHIDLHRKYGHIVRFGPNMVSVSDPKEIGTIYSFKKPWAKSDFYRAFLLKNSNKPIEGIFATQNEAIHRQLKRPIANVYSMSNLLSFEPYVDMALRVFIEQIEGRLTKNENTFDLSNWLQMLAFDLMGELTFSHRFGFMESGSDIDGAMSDLWKNSQKMALVTQMPWLENVWTNNPIQRYLRGGGTSPGVRFAMKRIEERRAMEKGELTKEWQVNNRDMLSRFMEVEAKDNTVPPYALMVWTGSNITAGSDSTAIFLRAFFYYLLHNTYAMEKLLEEIDGEAEAGRLEDLAGFKQVQQLPYFNACFQETGRMHPALGLPMERVVPPEGAVICGKFLEGGTQVGMSSWVTHHDKETFGEDCDIWRPERWLCEPEKRRQMERALLTFGHGHRDCIGKNIAFLEVHKIVPTLLRAFEFELLAPGEREDWEVYNRWFVTQKGFKVRMKKRSV